MRLDLTLVTLVLFVITSHAQTTAHKLICQFDLRRLGLQIPKSGDSSESSVELLFLSESTLLVLNTRKIQEPQTQRLDVLDVTTGSLQPAREWNGREWPGARSDLYGSGSSMQRVTEDTFAIASGSDIAVCNINFECKRTPGVTGPFRFSPDGKYVVVGRGTFFSSDGGLRFYPADGGPAATLRDESNATIGFVDDDSILYLSGKHHQPVVISSSGAERYRLSLRDLSGLPWDAAPIFSATGKYFGLEWKKNSRVQLLNPLACIDECPPPAVQRFEVFASSDGKLVSSYKWDPRPWNLYVIPAISPSGKLVAIVQGHLLNIYLVQ